MMRKTMTRNRHTAPLGLGAVTLGLALVLTGCSGADGDSKNKDGVKVVATTTQICDYVKQIADGQDTIDLTCLLAPNASAHDHEMTPKQMDALSKADLMLVNGLDLEHFLDSAVESSGFKGNMVVTTGVLTAADVDGKNAGKQDGKNYTIDLGAKKVDYAPWPFAPEAGEEAEFDLDPHAWTSPKQAKVQVENIGDALGNAAPKHKEEFDKKVGEYVKALDALDKWTADSLNSVPQANRVLFTSHDAFGYLSRDYNIKFIGSALTDFNQQQDATSDHIQQAAKEVKESGARALFAENSNDSKSIQAVARAAGVRAIIGDDALYGDSLGPDGSAGQTYIGSIVHNVTTLVDAWDGRTAEQPAELASAKK